MTRLTVPERSHCRRMMRAASTVASVVFLYCACNTMCICRLIKPCSWIIVQ